MAASNFNRIEVSPLPRDPRYQEALAAAGITPGMLTEITSTGTIQAHSTSGGVGAGFAMRTFAVENVADARGIDDDYVAGESTRYRSFESGDRVFALLADGESVTPASRLDSNGDGSLKDAGAEIANQVIGRSTETINNRSGNPVRIVVEIL